MPCILNLKYYVMQADWGSFVIMFDFVFRMTLFIFYIAFIIQCHIPNVFAGCIYCILVRQHINLATKNLQCDQFQDRMNVFRIDGWLAQDYFLSKKWLSHLESVTVTLQNQSILRISTSIISNIHSVMSLLLALLLYIDFICFFY